MDRTLHFYLVSGLERQKVLIIDTQTYIFVLMMTLTRIRKKRRTGKTQFVSKTPIGNFECSGDVLFHEGFCSKRGERERVWYVTEMNDIIRHGTGLEMS
jgi:hypothetical protein